MRAARFGIVALVTTLVMATTLGVEAQASRPEAPSGFKTVTIKKAGFSIAVPKAWVVLDVTRKDVSNIFSELKKRFPKLAASLPTNVESLVAQNIVLLALEQGASFHSNVNVLRIPGITQAPTITDIEASAKQVSPTATLSKTKVAGVSAVKVTYQLMSGTIPVATTQYALLGPKGGLSFTFTAAQDDPHTSVFSKMVKSIKLLRR